MAKDRKFYVYQILRRYNTSGVEEIVYIGRGEGYRINYHIRELKKQRHVNSLLQSWYDTNDSSWSVHKVYKDLTNEEANQLEVDLILAYGRFDLGEGTLANLTDGGEGMLGHKHTDETKAKLSTARMGPNNPMFGKPSYNRGRKHTPESLTKMRIAHQGKSHTSEAKAKISASTKNKPKSMETRKKMSERQLGPKNHMFGMSGEKHHNFGKKLSPESIAKRQATRAANRLLKQAIEN